MNYVESFDLFGVPAKQIPSITGKGVPASSTEGAVGCLYMDTDTGNLYKCTAVTSDVYTWVEIGNGSSKNENGLSETASMLIITILRNGVYSTDQSENITALEAALSGSGESGGDSGDSGGSGDDSSGDSGGTEQHTWVDGYFDSKGDIVYYADYMCCTEYFPVDSGEHYDLYCPDSEWSPDETHICFYDANKNFISRYHTITASEKIPDIYGTLVCLNVTLPDGTCFIRVSTHNVSAYKNSLVIAQDPLKPDCSFENVTWEEGYVGGIGNIAAESGCWASSFVSVEPGATYRFGNSDTAWTTTWYGIGIYSAVHGGFISRVTTAEFTVPDNAKYVRLSAQNMTGYCETATLTKVS